MPHHAASAPHGAWFHPTVRDGRRPAPRTVAAIVPSRGLAAALPAETVAAPRLSWLARLDRWCWSLEQKRIDDYLAQSVDAADLEWRQRRLERRGLSL